MKRVIKGLCLVLAGMVVLATVSFAQEPIGRLLTVEQEVLIQEKLEAKRQAGLPVDAIEKQTEDIALDQAVPIAPSANADGSVESIPGGRKLMSNISTVHLEVVLPSVDEVLQQEAEYLAAVEQFAGPEVAARVRQALIHQVTEVGATIGLKSGQDSGEKELRVIEVPRVTLGPSK